MSDTGNISGIEFTPKQLTAIDKAEQWLNEWNEDTFPFRLCGYAGTGKTTLLKELVNRLSLDYAAAAYTGKAALVMQRYNNMPATTIHSLIYKYVPVDKELCEELYSQINDATDERERSRLQSELDAALQPHFEMNLESDLLGRDLVVLDECSMVNDEILADLRSFKKPIIALGDPGQLPPIDGTGALFATAPDVMLEEIHRQALDNPIIAASMRCRNGLPLAFRDNGGSDPLSVLSTHDKRLDEMLLSHDQVLCGKNQTRRDLNEKMRRLLGKFHMIDPYPEKGDKIICTRNNRDKGLFNGQMSEVIERGEVLDNAIQYVILPEDAKEPIEIEIARADFDEYVEAGAVKKAKWWELKAERFDFGYAITVHKSQGSQWPSVLIYDDRMFAWGARYRVQRAQWLYTGVTRAAERLTVLR